MKLVVCPECNDIFNLTLDEKVCKCGVASGHYLPDKTTVYVSAKAVVLGFNNSQFTTAYILTDFSSNRGQEFPAFFITDGCGKILRRGE